MRHKSVQYSQFLHRPVLNLIEGSNFKYFKEACSLFSCLESVVSLKLLISAGCSFKTVTVYYLPHILHCTILVLIMFELRNRHRISSLHYFSLVVWQFNLIN